MLAIRKATQGSSWEPRHQFIGELSFQYGDSPRLPPLTRGGAREHIGRIDGRRVIWPRDYKAERSAEAELLASSLIRSEDSSTPNTYVPSHMKPNHESAWLNLLDSDEFNQLRNDGWIIEVDPRAGLTARDASSFVPATESDS